MKKHIFKTLFNENSNESFKLNIYFEKDSFYLTVLEDLTAWKASVNTNVLKELADQHECTVEEYCDKLSKYFHETPSDVVFSTDDKHFCIHQIILNKGNQIRAKYFQCEIEKADYKETVESFLDSFYLNAQELERKSETLHTENDSLQKSNTECRNKLEEFVYTRRLQEDDLYKNFIIILNEKKKRIQHLTELLEAFRKNRNIPNPIVVTKKHKRKKEKKPTSVNTIIKKEQVSESESEAGESTDDDDTYNNVKQETCGGMSKETYNNNIEESDLAKPSTSKTNDKLHVDFDMLRDDSPTREIILPKRLKRNDGSASQQISSSYDADQKPSGEQTPSENINKASKKEDPRPTINISTLDLLDNI